MHPSNDTTSTSREYFAGETATPWISFDDRMPPENHGEILVTNNIRALNAFGALNWTT